MENEKRRMLQDKYSHVADSWIRDIFGIIVELTSGSIACDHNLAYVNPLCQVGGGWRVGWKRARMLEES